MNKDEPPLKFGTTEFMPQFFSDKYCNYGLTCNAWKLEIRFKLCTIKVMFGLSHKDVYASCSKSTLIVLKPF